MKICSTCLEQKDESEFYLTQHGKPRRSCKKCKNKARNVWRKRNRTRALAALRRWQHINRICVNHQARKWRAANPEKISASNHRKYLRRKAAA